MALTDLSLSLPIMVWVFPLPVWPYAKTQTLYPSKAFFTTSCPRSVKTWLWVTKWASPGSWDQYAWSKAKLCGFPAKASRLFDPEDEE